MTLALVVAYTWIAIVVVTIGFTNRRGLPIHYLPSCRFVRRSMCPPHLSEVRIRGDLVSLPGIPK